MENIQEYKKCKHLIFCRYCDIPYKIEKKKFGYSDLTEYKCFHIAKYYDIFGEEIQYKHKFCFNFKKKSLLSRVVNKIKTLFSFIKTSFL